MAKKVEKEIKVIDAGSPEGKKIKEQTEKGGK